MPNLICTLPLVVSVLALGGVTACGAQTADGQQTTAANTPADVRESAVRVYEAFAGTRAQQDAGEVLRAYVVNGPMDACLEEHGHPEWDWSLSRGYADPYDPLSRTEWFADLGRRIYSENEIAARDYLAAEAAMNSDEPRLEKYEQPIDDCLASTDRPSESEVDSAGQPSGAQELIETWRSVMAKAGTEHGGSVDTYYECMDAAKIPVLEAAGRSYEDIAQVMGREAGRAPAPGQDPATYSEAWKEFLATEDQVLEADIACREDVHARGITAMGPVIAEFESQHVDEIARAQAGWDEIVARAEDLGYTGQRGPLGK